MIDTKCHSIGFYFTSELPFLTMCGAGHHYIDFHPYDWNSRTREQEICLIQYCISGMGMVEVAGITYPVGPGDAFLVDIPGENRYWLPNESDHWEILFLEFSKECLPLMRKIYGAAGPVLHLSEESGLQQRVHQIFEDAMANKLETFYENTKAAYNLWMDLTLYAVSGSDQESSKIDHAKAYLDQNYHHDDISLDQVAEHAGMSKYYLCKEFRKKFGISPGQYLKELRLSQACRLLSMDFHYTLQDIAVMVGYANNNYFGKVFKAAKGMTPEQFRQQANKYEFVQTVYDVPANVYTPMIQNSAQS